MSRPRTKHPFFSQSQKHVPCLQINQCPISRNLSIIAIVSQHSLSYLDIVPTHTLYLPLCPPTKKASTCRLMTETEARAIMKAHRWTYRERKRHKSHIVYVYAIRKKPHSRQQEDMYICPLSRLGELTEAELVAKLTRQPPIGKS